MGEMLAETERATGAKGIGKSAVTSGNRTPTLAALGISKRESAEAQLLAELNDEDFEKIKSGRKTKSKARKERKVLRSLELMKRAAAMMTAAAEKSILEVCDVRHCSCAELFGAGVRPDAVITDPPYPEKFLPVFSELALT
jgi:hypothetical protein